MFLFQILFHEKWSHFLLVKNFSFSMFFNLNTNFQHIGKYWYIFHSILRDVKMKWLHNCLLKTPRLESWHPKLDLIMLDKFEPNFDDLERVQLFNQLI